MKVEVSRHDTLKLTGPKHPWGTRSRNRPSTTEFEAPASDIRLRVESDLLRKFLRMEVKAKKPVGTGTRGGNPKEMAYSMVLLLDAADVGKIVKYAVAKGFLKIALTGPRAAKPLSSIRGSNRSAA